MERAADSLLKFQIPRGTDFLKLFTVSRGRFQVNSCYMETYLWPLRRLKLARVPLSISINISNSSKVPRPPWNMLRPSSVLFTQGSDFLSQGASYFYTRANREARIHQRRTFLLKNKMGTTVIIPLSFIFTKHLAHFSTEAFHIPARENSCFMRPRVNANAFR